MSKEDLIDIIRSMVDGGVSINFHGKRISHEVFKKVRPRQTIIKKDLCVGEPEEQVRNLLIEGENLQAMVTLYKERGQVDLILTDPPYNTGQTFRYNDKWDEDPNDPDLGQVVKLEDGSRHTKWMKAMLPRLHMMRAMLKPSGVIAICIDDNELFHLGMMMDEVFGEESRLAIINWQKTYSPKTTKHVSTATEYVLVYAKDPDLAKTMLLPRDEGMDARYTNDDGDPDGAWKGGDATAPQPRTTTVFGVQSPYTGLLHYPEGEFASPNLGSPSNHWRLSKAEIKTSLIATGVDYEERDLGDGRGNALVIKGSTIGRSKHQLATDKAAQRAKECALRTRAERPWPVFYFSDARDGRKGEGRPALKRYIGKIAKGRIPWTYWADDEYDVPLTIGTQSWSHQESGHSQAGLSELDAVLGKGHGFQTVKPLRLIQKIIQIWCPPSGLVLDPYAGSGTTGHAVLELNAETDSQRRFILIEQGAPERGDKYARSLTQVRLQRAITGERPAKDGKLKQSAKPLPGGFQFRQLTQKIDSRAVLSMKKEELIDLVITSHWDSARRNSAGVVRFEGDGLKYLVGRNDQNEGYFLIWNGGDKVGQLDENSYATVVAEGKKAGLKHPYHVYARYEIYQSRNVIFYKIPDKILADLGLNESSDSFNEEEGM